MERMGLEPTTSGMRDQRSRQLSYHPEEDTNHESGWRDSNPQPPDWQSSALPLSYTR